MEISGLRQERKAARMSWRSYSRVLTAELLIRTLSTCLPTISFAAELKPTQSRSPLDLERSV